jgi:hypothetical protein
MSPSLKRGIRLLVGVFVVARCVIAPSACAAADRPAVDSGATDATADSAVPATVEAIKPGRPKILTGLYISFTSLQALDIDSTTRARSSGAREANPLIGDPVGFPVRLVGMKAGATAGIILASERLRAHHRVAAILMLTAFNAVYGVIAIHNYSLARQ